MAILPELHCSQDFVKEKKKVYIHYGKEKIYYLFIHSFIHTTFKYPSCARYCFKGRNKQWPKSLLF